MMSFLRHASYRVFQCLLSGFQVFLPQPSPECLTGAGSIKKLPSFIKGKGVQRVLIVTDKTLHKIGLLDSLFQACDEAGLPYSLFDEAEINPSFQNVEAAYAAYVKDGCQGFIAFGGGSAMDCAKAASARVARPRKSLEQLAGTLRVLRRPPPFFAVPTTAGTGSEGTIAAVITNNKTHQKVAIQDTWILPRYAVLDPELTVGLPPHITATTGMDAMTHAVEAYLNKFAPAYTRRLSESAVRTIFDNIGKVFKDGKDIEARANMLQASLEAGRAFSRACVGYVHAIAHTLGGLYCTPHGLANAVIMPHVLRAYGAYAHPPLARLAEKVGIRGENDAEKALAFIARLEEMNKEMDLPQGFECIDEKDIDQMITWALKEANPIYPVPEIWDRQKMRAVIEGIRRPQQPA